MSPRRRAGPAPKPQSALSVVHAVRRVHKRADFIMVPRRRVLVVLKAPLWRCIVECGPEALLPRRKEPLYAGIMRRIRLLPHGSRVGRRLLKWPASFFVSVRWLLALGLTAGFHKNKLSLPNGAEFDATRMSRAHFGVLIGGIDIAAPTPGQLLSLKEGN
jgi:hypothetical protein